MKYKIKTAFGILVGVCFISFIVYYNIPSKTVHENLNMEDPSNNVENIVVHEKLVNDYKDARSLENDADLVVEVQATKTSVNHMETTEDGLPLYYWTENEFEVTKILANKVNENLKTITIFEPYATMDKTNQLIIPEGYSQTIPNKKYVFYLVKSSDGSYYLPSSSYVSKVDLQAKFTGSTEETMKKKEIRDSTEERYRLELK
jgi:hypothetical protein